MMHADPTSPSAVFLANGPWGAAVVALAGALSFLFWLNEKRRDEREKALVAENLALRLELREEHKARLGDAHENTKAMLEVHDQQNKALDVVRQVLERLDRRRL